MSLYIFLLSIQNSHLLLVFIVSKPSPLNFCNIFLQLNSFICFLCWCLSKFLMIPLALWICVPLSFSWNLGLSYFPFQSILASWLLKFSICFFVTLLCSVDRGCSNCRHVSLWQFFSVNYVLLFMLVFVYQLG